MKNKSIWVFILILQLSTSVSAQPTIDSSWYYPFSTTAIRNSSYVYTVGSAGLGQTWDFDSLNLFSLHNCNINFSPNGFIWGGINTDYEFNYFVPSSNGNSIYEKYYESNTSDSLVLNGISTNYYSGGMAGSSSYANYTNPLLILKFPFTYQTMAIDSFECTSNYNSSGWGSVTTYRQRKGKRELLVDGFGDLILPDGMHSNSFRIKNIDAVYDTSWNLFNSNSFVWTKIELTFSYWTTDNGILQKRYEIRKDSLINGLVPANPSFSANYYGGISLVGIYENNFISSDGLVFPNPVLDYSTIKAHGILIKKAKLEIYNSIAGLTQELSIVPTEVDQISFETIRLAPGYYKAVIRQDDKVWTAGFIKQ